MQAQHQSRGGQGGRRGQQAYEGGQGPARPAPRNTYTPPTPDAKRNQLLELCIGCILWLPYEEPNAESIRCVRPNHCDAANLREEAHGHPVLVLGIEQRPGSSLWGDVLVRVCDITTFNQTPLYGDRSHQANQHLIKFAESMPIYQHGSVWGKNPNWLQLSVGVLKEQSYVRAQHVWQISMGVLWNYYWNNSSAWSVRLSEESYFRLMARLNLPPQRYESLNELPILGPARLEAFSRIYAPNPYPVAQPQQRDNRPSFLSDRLRQLETSAGAGRTTSNTFPGQNLNSRPTQPAAGNAEPRNRSLDPTRPSFQPHMNRRLDSG
ncbi:hypothetical protein VTL71DRAFT_11167 [Oculimacula yallundae]|uniref:Uncharacterized protein n=1 Tax=Oculimacula yallundae TaxID=86028 RepID=A0ABR4CV68_9HELO